MTAQAGAIVDLPVRVTSAHDKVVETTLRVQRWTVEERTRRVWKRLGLCWGAALLAGLVPPHIPWFTIVFLSGPVAAWLASRQKALIFEQTLPCPDCGTPSQIEEQGETWPLGARCSPCGSVFWTTPIPQEELSRGAPLNTRPSTPPSETGATP